MLLTLLVDLLDLALPGDCAGCRRPGPGLRHDLCPGCVVALAAPLVREHRPSPCPAGLPPLCAAAAYGGLVRAALLAHKEQGRLALARPLGGALALAVAAALPGDSGAGDSGAGDSGAVGAGAGGSGSGSGAADSGAGRSGRPLLLVPVPSLPAVVRARGHDHALRLARAAAVHLCARGLPARAAPLLQLARRTADQSGLDRTGRARNLAGALRARGGGGDGRVILVDDVVTTGATLAEAARALRAAGTPVCAAAVVAATSLRRDAVPHRADAPRPAARPAEGCPGDGSG